MPGSVAMFSRGPEGEAWVQKRNRTLCSVRDVLYQKTHDYVHGSKLIEIDILLCGSCSSVQLVSLNAKQNKKPNQPEKQTQNVLTLQILEIYA